MAKAKSKEKKEVKAKVKVQEKERDYIHISCLIDHLQGKLSDDISKAAESLAMHMGVKGIETAYGVPACIQYTRGVGNFVQNLSKSDVKSALLFDSPEAFDFTTELIEGDLNLFLIEDSLSLSELSFPLCPDGNGWKVVILEDIIPAVGGDEQLIKMLRSISAAMVLNGLLIIRVAEMADNKSWNKEYNDTVVTESFEKTSLRRYDRVITAHGAVNMRHKETLNAFSISDIHSCAREAHFRPTRETGLDPSSWCCYEKVV